eukprot:TRINITY_DN111550_c0_g1_i1.p1 TRINITY_DN111550_c0_g1~~TRINITY_DN111550_c0_g1_i1.p1  ORF type:complete len:137 (-),score=4.73 TRINITY_DN111550_c0_g1_i1:6-416(-)
MSARVRLGCLALLGFHPYILFHGDKSDCPHIPKVDQSMRKICGDANDLGPNSSMWELALDSRSPVMRGEEGSEMHADLRLCAALGPSCLASSVLAALHCRYMLRSLVVVSTLEARTWSCSGSLVYAGGWCWCASLR